MECECKYWARDNILLVTEHHQNCRHYNPEQEARERIEALLTGIVAWAADEDGIHDACFDAFRDAAYFIGRPDLVKGGDIDMTDKRVLTCVYCGQEYPQETPAWGNKVLTDHIKVCPKHPIKKLKNALEGLVGASTREELEAMEGFLRSAPGIEADKIVAINAIHALLEVVD